MFNNLHDQANYNLYYTVLHVINYNKFVIKKTIIFYSDCMFLSDHNLKDYVSKIRAHNDVQHHYGLLIKLISLKYYTDSKC